MKQKTILAMGCVLSLLALSAPALAQGGYGWESTPAEGPSVRIFTPTLPGSTVFPAAMSTTSTRARIAEAAERRRMRTILGMAAPDCIPPAGRCGWRQVASSTARRRIWTRDPGNEREPPAGPPSRDA